MPYISFVVTCYNFAPYIGECLESILGQKTLRDYEIIVIDDASTDESETIIRSYQDARIRYIRHETNRGAVATIQEGFLQARGEHIARIDGDDRYRSDYLEQVIPILERYPQVGFVYGDVAQMNVQGEIVQDPWTGVRSNIVHNGRDFMGDEYLALVMEHVVPVCTMMMRRAVLERVLPFPTELLFMDWYLVLQLARDHQVYYMARTFADYRLHPQNRHRQLQTDRAYVPTVLSILDRVFSEPDRQAAKQQIRRRLYGGAYLRFGDSAFGAGQMKLARVYYRRALTYAPGCLMNPGFIRHYLATWIGAEGYARIKAQLRGNKLAS